MKKRIKVKDLQRHYYTDDYRFYSTKEIKRRPHNEEGWIPYDEYIRVLIQIVKLKNKSLSTFSKKEKGT